MVSREVQKPYLDKWLHPMAMSKKVTKEKNKDVFPWIPIILQIINITNTNTTEATHTPIAIFT